ncbi:MAG: VWA domain-containing protein [Vicinamibacterales bacterium]
MIAKTDLARSCLAGLAVLCGLAVPAAQRQGRPPQAPTFRSTVDLVQVDVVAVDAQGHHVKGLTADDFELIDRKQPQTIATFEEVTHDYSRASAFTPRLPPTVRLDVASNQSAVADRLIVMVIDDLHIYRGRTDRARDLARDVVTQLGPEASMAVLFTSGEHSTEVTEDRTRLLDAIDTLEARQSWRRPHQALDNQKPAAVGAEMSMEAQLGAVSQSQSVSVQDFFDNMTQFRTLQDAARMLGTGAAQRKAFVLVSEGIEKDMRGQFESDVTPCDAVSPMSPCFHDHALQDMMNSLQRSNVATYAIDPRGRVASEDLLRETFPAPAGLVTSQDGGADSEDSPFYWSNPVRLAQSGLRIMAEASGGFAVTDTDDFASGLDRIVEDLDHYYLLGFYPAEPGRKGWRKLDVKVKRPGITLRFRSGYDPAGPPAPPANTTPLTRLAGGALPVNDLPMRLQAVALPPPSGGNPRVALALELTVPRAALEEADARAVDEIQYGVFAVDLKTEKVRELIGRGARLALRPSVTGRPLPEQVAYMITASMSLPPGRYQLRASATSAKLDLGGSVYLSLDVPEFSKAPLVLTDLAIGYARGARVPVARDDSAAPDLLPFAPTLDRVFRPRDTLRVYAGVVQATPAALGATVSVLTADGRELRTWDSPLPEVGPRAVDLTLSLRQFLPGSYRLLVRVFGGGQLAEREVGMEIREPTGPGTP